MCAERIIYVRYENFLSLSRLQVNNITQVVFTKILDAKSLGISQEEHQFKSNMQLKQEVHVYCIQSNLDYPDLDYPDFSIIRTFSLVPIL